ncbi:MAG: type II toxin-antitoxin system RelE/ParE family toxin [Lysobacteraceae bacterium]
MAAIYFANEVGTDFQRILAHLREHAATDGAVRLAGLVAAIDVLAANPLIGRPTADGCRELVIGRGMRGYIALYSYDEPKDLVRILAVRSQKESGFHRP